MDTTLDAERFGDRYAASTGVAFRHAELEALGSDYGATGYTTRAQADELGRLLGLGPGSILLDVGAGCGWPGIYLASTTGCSVISTDTIPEGAVVARTRADADGVGDRVLVALANGENIPLRRASVDAVVHTDVLC